MVTGKLQPKKEKYPALERICQSAFQECAKTHPHPKVRKIWVVLETNRMLLAGMERASGRGPKK